MITRTFLPILLLCIVCTANVTRAQEFIFMEPDAVKNCALIKSGTFKSSTKSFEEYRLVVKNNICTEYVEDGKYHVSSRMDFIDPCTYKSTVMEVTIPDYPVKPGAFVISEILETECKFIKVHSKMGENELTSVFEKQD